jgi:hypothetical protein
MTGPDGPFWRISTQQRPDAVKTMLAGPDNRYSE